MSSKMEQIIEEIEEYIDGCKFQPLSSTKIIVNKEELEELIAELRAKTPEEVKRYQKIIRKEILFRRIVKRLESGIRLRRNCRPVMWEFCRGNWRYMTQITVISETV